MANTPNGGDRVVTADGNHSPVHMTKYPNLGYKFACSERFGELSPFFKFEGEPKDVNVTLTSVSSVDSMTLHAPILQDIKHNKDFYLIDKRAALPRTWEFIFNPPSHGDDIDASKANTLLYLNSDSTPSVYTFLHNLIVSSPLWDGLNASFSLDFNISYFISWLRSFAAFNEFFAPDSLFAKFRMPLADIFDSNGGTIFFEALDDSWTIFHGFLESFQSLEAPFNTIIGDITRNIQVWFRDSDNSIVLRKVYNFETVEGRMAFYYDFLDNSNIQFASFFGSPFSDDYDLQEVYTGNIDSIVDSTTRHYKSFKFWNSVTDDLSSFFDVSNVRKPLNIFPIIAYQLCAAEYQTNDLIDYIYSVKLYRSRFESFVVSNGLTFDYNGESLPYDGFSAITLAAIIENGSLLSYDLIMSLITHKRSLRYVDYFVGSRPTPLSAADTPVEVNSGVASVIDITQNALISRLKLFIQRVGRKTNNYLNEIFHSSARVDLSCPVKIGTIHELIYKEETQNTAADQLELDNSRTATLKAHNHQFAFNTDIDERSIIIGLSSYEITRFYDRGLDPFALKVDRYDDFNPMLQYLGDQPISQSELNAGLPVDDYFGYTNRNMEYKVGVDYCAGAFRNELKDWIFRQPAADRDTVIGPDFIRAHQNELDRYYVALTATTSYGRYHFICKYNNKLVATRNMVFAPLLKF